MRVKKISAKRDPGARSIGSYGCIAFWLAMFTLFLSVASAFAMDKSYRVAILLPGDEWVSSVDGLKEGMSALRYSEGREVEYIFANAKTDKARIAELTQRFLTERVDVLFTITNTALKIVAQETRGSKLPVVFGSASGPVESGIVPAYATPDSHVTGVTSGSIELVAKRLEMLREILPKTRRVAAIGDADSDSSRAAFAVAAETAEKLQLKLIEHRVRGKEEALEVGTKITPKDADAMFLLPGLHGVGAMTRLAAAAMANRLPFAVYQVEHVKKDGALLSYGSSYYLQGKQSATLVHKILKGTPVYQIPIERPALHELILNLVTAKKIGVTFSPVILNRADEVVADPKG
jgi:putative tryptophan/tyrosine transport system substrate-binding protein